MDRKRLAVRFSSTLATIGLYLPILAGIITPMLWLLPAWYTAWNVVGFIFPFSDIWGGLWLPFSGDSPLLSVLLLPIWLIEVALFLGGLGISVWGLRELAVKHVEGCGLVTTGPYRWTRHPQHLGIILFLLPTALFSPTHSMLWIRPGDILSWSLISFLLLIVADWEEIRLRAVYGQEYEAYISRTAFILPGLKLPLKLTDDKYRPILYVVLFVLYWVLITLVLIAFTHVQLVWTR
jgi:protein-S-isoprenylcysteine O-methyltransferase Ste14